MSDPLETSELLAFAKTVDSRSLSRAAAELGVPRATISRRLARLEERLGARLLRRTTRSLALTDAGEALYRHAKIVLEALASAEASVRRADDVVRGDLRISVPPMLSDSFFAMLGTFAQRFPEVRMHVHATTQHVDLMRGGYDVAIRATAELEPGMTARTLARMPLLAVASPAYLAARGTPRTRKELRNHRCLMGFARGETPQTHWPFPGGGKLHVEGSFFANEMPLLVDAAVRGLGIALVPLMAAYEHLQNGALVHVLQGAISADSRVAVVFLEREFVPPHVRAFVDAVVAWAPNELGRPLPQCKVAAPKSRTRGRRGSRP